jgi:branched-chain amino acid transport system permease protein
MTTETDGHTPSTSAVTLCPQPPKEGRGWLWSLLVGLLILGCIALVPLNGDPADLHTWTTVLMFIVLAQGWNFIGGFTGYSAFGNVAFFGIGAYATGLVLQAGQPFWLGVVCGALVAAVFAFLLGLPVLRLKGHYFAIATLGTAEALRELVAARNIGGGGGGLMLLPLPPLSAYVGIFYAFLGLALLCLLFTTWLTRSRFGYALVAIRESEEAAEALGISTHLHKVAAFVLSAVPTAIAGGLFAYWVTGFDPPTVFAAGISVEMVLLCILGGSGTILGPLIGAILFEAGSFQLQISGFSLHNTLLGLSILLVTVLLPQGILRLFQKFLQRPVPGTSRFQMIIEGVQRVRRVITENGI